MNVIAKCYRHNDELAVATCSSCGKYICKMCLYENYEGKTICPDCMDRILDKEHDQKMAAIKERGGRFVKGYEFILFSIIGIAAAALFFLYIYFFEKRDFNEMLASPIKFIFASFMFYCIPYGYVWLSDIFPSKTNSTVTHLANFILKLGISLALGWAFFLFYLIRFIVRKILKRNSEN